MSSALPPLTRSARSTSNPARVSRALTPTRSVRAVCALALANARYWTSVAPLVRTRIARWEERVGEIPDPTLRGLARGKLREERFNVEVAATLATLAPRAMRKHAIEAIVALQIAYDYLDVLTEQPLEDPLRDAARLYRALVEAFDPTESSGSDAPPADYLHELAATIRSSLALLPGAPAVALAAQRAVERCVQAQVLGHAAARASTREVERWARGEAAGSALCWQELLAGAQASVLCLHALLAAAAQPGTTTGDADALDEAYLSIGALTMLDGLIDREDDLTSGALAYPDLYDSHEQMAQRLAAVARDAVGRTDALPHAAHHTMALVGVVAYYASAPAAAKAPGRVVFAAVRDALAPLSTPTLAVVRAWRAAKRLRRGFDAHRRGIGWC